MHARIDQLLSLRDGEPVDVEVRIHVQQCAHCQAEAALLANTRTRLFELPTFDPPADMFAQIANRAAQPPAHRMRFGVAAAAVAILAAVVGIVAIRDASQSPQLGDRAPESRTTPVYADAEVQSLIAQSRELDLVLQRLPDRPQVERVSLAATVDSIEERIQVLDWQLAYGSDAGLDRSQARRLWSERVELMDSLVKVRYAESAPMAF
jgi:hypothetical protein